MELNKKYWIRFLTASFSLSSLSASESDDALWILGGAVGLPLAPVPRRPQQLGGVLVPLGVKDVRKGEGWRTIHI